MKYQEFTGEELICKGALLAILGAIAGAGVILAVHGSRSRKSRRLDLARSGQSPSRDHVRLSAES